MNRMLLAGSLSLFMSLSSRGQGFVNLDFESAQVVFTTGGIVASNAFLGWSVFSGTNQLSVVAYDASFVGAPQLIGSNANVIAGNFSVELGSGSSISQTGLVPSNSESLLFDAVSPSPLVALGGLNLFPTLISVATNNVNGRSYGVYGADISSFAGQVETLAFSGSAYLDDIQFSPQVVPEPSASLLFLASGFLFYVRRVTGLLKYSH